jgi:hypothetical protein
MASVFLGDDDCPFIVAETPREIAALVRDAIRNDEPLIELTLANDSDWNSKPLIARADRVVAACPPKEQGEEDE